MRTLFAAALIAAATVTPALAQEAAPFTGPRVEAILGYDRNNPGDDFEDNSEGLVYGGAIGYDFQLGGVILGVEGEATGSTSRNKAENVFVTGDRYRAAAGRDLYAGARLGFAVAPSTMIYAKGGYTNARTTLDYTPVTGAATRTAFNAEGYRVGAGIEQKFNLFGPSGYVKAEYRYSNYSSVDIEDVGRADIDLDRHQAIVGIGVRF